MELISQALCIVCLDETGGDRPDLDTDTNAMLRAMHGAGTRHHSANRWFDKTVQVSKKYLTVKANLSSFVFHESLASNELRGRNSLK